MNETDGSVAKSYDQVKKIDNASHETTQLKDVAEGMNDPASTENGVIKETRLAAATEEKSGFPTWMWGALGVIVVIVAGGVLFMKNRSGNK